MIIGSIAAGIFTLFLVFVCSTITQESVDAALKKQAKRWGL